MTSTEARTQLEDRVRRGLTELGVRSAVISERRMVGGHSFLVGDTLVAGVRHDGDLLVRVSPEQDEELQQRRGAHRATMGPRTMSAGWLGISPETLDDAALTEWLSLALEENRRLTGRR